MKNKNNDIIKYDKNRLLEAILRHLSFQDYENTPESIKINLNVNCTRYNDTKHGAYVRFPQQEDDFKILSDISLKLTTNVPILDNIPIKDKNIKMKKRQDIFFVKINRIHVSTGEVLDYKYINYKEIQSISTREIPTKDGYGLNEIHIVTLRNDPFCYKISDTDYKRLIDL